MFSVTYCCNGLMDVILRFTEHTHMFRSVIIVIRVRPSVFHHTAHKGTLVPERGPLCNPTCLFSQRLVFYILHIHHLHINFSFLLSSQHVALYLWWYNQLNYLRFLRKMILFWVGTVIQNQDGWSHQERIITWQGAPGLQIGYLKVTVSLIKFPSQL